MTSKNPLALAGGAKSGGGWGGNPPPEDLDAYVARLNGMHFTREAGWQWFVNVRRRDDGSRELFLDRRNAPMGEQWKPSAAETEATHQVVARAIAHGLTMAEFASHVRRGTIAREVNLLLAEWASEREPA